MPYFCTQTDVEQLLTAAGLLGRLDDDGDGMPSTSEILALTGQGIRWATAKVLWFAGAKYDTADLSTSDLVNEWCTILAARWACARAGNPVPKSLQDLYDEAVGEMKEVRSGEGLIPDLGYRNIATPAWSNVRVDTRYNVRKVRIERSISERTPVTYGQAVDWPSEGVVEG